MYIARARWECQLAGVSSWQNDFSSWGWAIDFKFSPWSSIAQSVCGRVFSLLGNGFHSEHLGSNPGVTRGMKTCLLLIRKSLACARASKFITNMNVFTFLCMYNVWSPETGAKVNWQCCQIGWMLAHHRDGLWGSSLELDPQGLGLPEICLPLPVYPNYQQQTCMYICVCMCSWMYVCSIYLCR